MSPNSYTHDRIMESLGVGVYKECASRWPSFIVMAWLRALHLLQLRVRLDADDVDNVIALQRFRQQHRRRWWVRPWLQRRVLYGQYEMLMAEMARDDPASFRNFIRMDPAMFQELLNRLGPRITKQDTIFRKALHPGLRLAITIRFLATGDSYKMLMYGFRVSHSTICLLVRQVCQAIFDEFHDEFVSCPTTAQEWMRVAQEFSDRWQFHHALGALDGKHIAIRCPNHGGSYYHNYKGFHSIVLLALVDADYKFIWADIGANGAASDAQIFGDSELKEAIENGTIGFPVADHLPNDDQDTPYFIIGDDAFALRTWLMKPFGGRNLQLPERIFNYRLSRARRIVENAFGILGNRFRCLLTTMCLEPANVTTVVLACICLHNLMRVRYPTLQNAVLDQEDQNHQLVPGDWRNGAQMRDVDNVVGGNRQTRAAKQQREYLKLYLSSAAGAVDWQDRMV